MTEAIPPSWAGVREGVCHIVTEDINTHHLVGKWLGFPRLYSKPFLHIHGIITARLWGIWGSY